MKKYIIPLSLAVMVMASCSIKEEQPLESDGTHMVLIGNASTSTRVSIGEKNGDVYPLLWYTGDAISIYSTDGTISGEVANLASAYSGRASGSFMTENDVVPASATEIYVLYPSTLKYTGTSITGYLYPTQNQPSANSSSGIGSRCFAFGTTSLSAGQTDNVNFTLSHKTAFAKFVIQPIEGYEDYYLTGITFSTDGSKYVAGSLTYLLDEDRLSLTEGSSSITVSIANGSVLSEAQSVYLTAYPVDLTGTSVTVMVNLDKDGNTIGVPIIFDGGELKEGCLSVVNVEQDSGGSWYEPIDVRDFMDEVDGGGYAYGAANTYFIEQKESESNSVNIDIKARGNYDLVSEPKYYSLLIGSSDIAGRKLLFLPDGIDEYQSIPTNEVNSDGTATVYCYSQAEGTGHWGTIGIYDGDYNLLWSFMICKYITGDAPGEVTYPTGTVLFDRLLGSPYSSKMAEQKGTFDQPAAALFQWGRKDPFAFDDNGYFSLVDADSDEIDMDYTIKHPTEMVYTSQWNLAWWTGNTDLLWGGGTLDKGHETDVSFNNKTIYDPCPEGYRVPDSATMYPFMTGMEDNSAKVVPTCGENVERWEPAGSYHWDEGQYENSNSPFYAAGESCLAYKLSDGSYDYWPDCGINFAASHSYSGSAYEQYRTANALTSGFGYWSCNVYASDTKVRRHALMYAHFEGEDNNYKYFSRPYSKWAFGVRCQKED